MENKKNSKLKIIIVCIVLAIIICISFIVSKYNQYKILMNVVEESNKVSSSGNYYYEVESPDMGCNKLWVKSDYSKLENNSGDTRYSNFKENKQYFVDNDNKIYTVLNIVSKPGFINFPSTLTLLRNDETLSTMDIMFSIKELKTENINNIECYTIRYENDLGSEVIWVNKETLLPIKCQSENNFSATYTITVNTVTDDDVQFNSSEYTLLEQ